MTEQEKKSIEYVIGIDLGHGETSAALCPLQWDVLPSQLDPAKDLEMGGNKKVMPSAITILDNGNAYIGDAAFNPEVLRHAEVRVCFKKAPKDINGELEQLMIRFMREVYKRIRENNSGLLTDGNHVVYIATPSGWDKATRELYLQMAKEAGLPIAGVTKESRAAFVRAQHDTTSGLGRNIEKGAIVFDMGSSTLDFTYKKKNLRPLDFGYNCGASAIEKAIYAMKREEEDCIKDFGKKFPKLVDFLVFEARKVKEQAYIDPTLRVKKTINFEDIVDDDDLEDERFRLVFQPGELNQLLEKNGYIQQIADAMTDYRENHIKGQNIYGVFMTGGASRMDFLKPMICKYFGIEEGQVYRDQDPSLTISQGVAEVARMDMRTEGMDEGLGSQIDALINGSQVFNTFAQNFTTEAFNLATQIIADYVTLYKDHTEGDPSINDLNSAIETDMNEQMGQLTSNVSEYVKNAIMDSTADIRKRVDDIVAVYTSQGTDIKLPTLTVPKIRMGSISIRPVLDKIAQDLADQTSTWSTGGAAAGAAAGAAIGSIVPFFGTITGALIGGAIGAFSGDKSTAGEEKEKLRDRDERLKIYNVIDSEWEDIKSNVKKTVDKNVYGNKEIRGIVQKVTSDYLKAYKDSLKNSRILID